MSFRALGGRVGYIAWHTFGRQSWRLSQSCYAVLDGFHTKLLVDAMYRSLL